MSDDWTTARVVRDRQGTLWFRDDYETAWTAHASSHEDWGAGELEAEGFGPLTPVLDADGMPVVRTVGDLTARHAIKRPEVVIDGKRGRLMVVKPSDLGDQLVTIVTTDGRWLDVPLDTPCEVIR